MLNKNKILNILEIILIVFLEVFILIFQSRHELWLDELDWGIGIIENRNLVEVFLVVLQTGENLPLFYIILFIANKLFGYNQFGLIFCTSIIWSFIGIIFMIKIAREFFNKNIEFIIVFLIFISNTYITWCSWQLRPYGMLFGFSIITLYFFLRKLKDYNKTNLFLYTISIILLMYCHWYGVIMTLCYAFIEFILFLKKRINIKNIISYIIAGITFLPTFIAILYYHNGDIKDFGVDPPTLQLLYDILTFLINSDWLIIFLIGIVALIIYSIKNKNTIYVNIILYSAIILFAIVCVYSFFINPNGSILRTRYFIVVLPHAIILFSIIIEKIKNIFFQKINIINALFLEIFILYLILVTINTYHNIYIQPNAIVEGNFKEKSNILKSNNDIYSDDTLIICVYGKEWIRYYFEDQGVQMPENIICVDPLNYPNTKNNSPVYIENFEYLTKNGEYVEDQKIEMDDLLQYKTIYIFEIYRTLDEDIENFLNNNYEYIEIGNNYKKLQII